MVPKLLLCTVPRDAYMDSKERTRLWLEIDDWMEVAAKDLKEAKVINFLIAHATASLRITGMRPESIETMALVKATYEKLTPERREAITKIMDDLDTVAELALPVLVDRLGFKQTTKRAYADLPDIPKAMYPEDAVEGIWITDQNEHILVKLKNQTWKCWFNENGTWVERYNVGFEGV